MAEKVIQQFLSFLWAVPQLGVIDLLKIYSQHFLPRFFSKMYFMWDVWWCSIPEADRSLHNLLYSTYSSLLRLLPTFNTIYQTVLVVANTTYPVTTEMRKWFFKISDLSNWIKTRQSQRPVICVNPKIYKTHLATNSGSLHYRGTFFKPPAWTEPTSQVRAQIFGRMFQKRTSGFYGSFSTFLVLRRIFSVTSLVETRCQPKISCNHNYVPIDGATAITWTSI